MEKVVKDSQSHTASCERTGCKDCLKTRSSSELVNKHVQQVVNSVELKQSKIIKNTVQRKNPNIQQKINQGSKQRGTQAKANTFDKLTVCQV